MKKISIIGLGFVGLTTAVGFAYKGFKVFGFDIDEEKTEFIRNGKIPFFENGLEKIMKQVISTEKLEIVDSLEKAVESSEICIICVGTPNINNIPSIESIKNIAKDIGKVLKNSNRFFTICVKSTVPPSTTDQIIRELLESESKKECYKDFGLVYNPEFLREGFAIEDFLNPDRIVIGANDQKSFTIVKEIYEVFNAPIVRTNLRTAEFIKYSSNYLLSALISFSNELSRISDAIGDIDIKKVFEVLHMDRRIEINDITANIASYIYAGCGFGGSCLPKDTVALSYTSKEYGFSPALLDSVIEVNITQKAYVVEKLSKILSGLENKHIAVLGLAFKPDTDDIRESPAISIINLLLEKGAEIFAYDPKANENFSKVILGINISKDEYACVTDADAVLLLTAWNQFSKLDFTRIRKLMRGNVVFDGRLFLDKEKIEGAGLKYFTI